MSHSEKQSRIRIKTLKTVDQYGNKMRTIQSITGVLSKAVLPKEYLEGYPQLYSVPVPPPLPMSAQGTLNATIVLKENIMMGFFPSEVIVHKDTLLKEQDFSAYLYAIREAGDRLHRVNAMLRNREIAKVRALWSGEEVFTI